ncbi:LysR family transcriptional regulator [Anaerotruncus sp. 80]|uniref:LysR family transcriptional regulator n=2 Tax=Oscillospiraceae TaxID=216572 RepID=A0A845QLT7_9FIRM|nr:MULTISPECIES: LysR family transcriptional regulator [Anaerotruncus]NBH62095.1 LysR family transcriptional regulator [Anaerotruncus colihominis]NCF02750.1 LysR family transcriptional regulator [Anaerotruncus sp. 80]
MIDIQDILCVLEVAKEKCITNAAANMFLTQSAVSQKIARTEKELGMTLFERTNRSVELTEDGMAFAKQGSHLVEEWEQFLAEMKRRTLKKEQFLTIGMHALSIYSDLPELIADFTAVYPNWKINLSTHSDSFKSIQNGKTDIFFVFTNTENLTDECALSQISLKEDTLCILLHEADVLASKETVETEDLAGYHLISWNTELMESFPEELGITLTVCEDSFLPSLISKPGSFTLTPKSRCEKILQQYSNLRAVPFKSKGIIPVLTLYLVYNSNRITAENHPFLQYAVDYYKQQEEK